MRLRMGLNVQGREISGRLGRKRRARIQASYNRIISERHFEQGPAQSVSDLLLAPALPQVGAAVVTTLALVVVAGAVASLRI